MMMQRAIAGAGVIGRRPMAPWVPLVMVLTILGASLSADMIGARSRPDGSSSITMPVSAPKGDVQEHYGSLPLAFERNVGQAPPSVLYLAQGQGSTTFLEAGQMEMVPAGGGTPVDMRLVGAAQQPAVSHGDALPATVNYMIGNVPARWHTGIGTYAAVMYHNVYPGIDMTWHGSQATPEYDFTVAPGANPAVITVQFTGASSVTVTSRGELVVATRTGTLRQHAPLIYQDSSAGRHPVAGRFLLEGGDRVGFAVGQYDASRVLVIDPTFTYSTYLGGSLVDWGRGIAVDAAGDAYITGRTCSVDFPTTPDSVQPAYGGAICNGNGGSAFISKLNAQGTQLVYSTYVGGTGSGEEANAIAIDGSGDAYIAGDTYARDFPTTPGAFESPPFAIVAQRAFVTELNPAGTALLYSTYLGAVNQGGAAAYALAVHSGDIYIAGNTYDRSFPTTSGAPQQTYSVGSGEYFDAFVAKLDPSLPGDGSGVISAGNQQDTYATYLGGNGDEKTPTFGLAVDGEGYVYVDGLTSSTNFPVTANAFQTTNRGTPNPPDYGYNVFVSKIDPAGNGLADLTYSSYLGGSLGFVGGRATLALGPPALASGSMPTIYLAGSTEDSDFPTTPGAFETSWQGDDDGFVSKLNPAGGGSSDLMYSTYLGSAGREEVTALAVTASGDAVVTGLTFSSGFPTKNAIQPTCGCFTGLVGHDAVVAEIDPTVPGAAGLIFSTFLGGTGDDGGWGIAVDSAGSVYVTGFTNSPQPSGSKVFPPLPFPTSPGAFQPAFAGPAGPSPDVGDAFVTKIAFADASVALSAAPDPATVHQALTYTITSSNAGPSPVTATATDVLPKGLKLLSTSAGCTSVTAKHRTTVTCLLGAIASGASAQASITVQPATTGAITNTVSEDGNAVDLTPGDNSATLATSVQR